MYYTVYVAGAKYEDRVNPLLTRSKLRFHAKRHGNIIKSPVTIDCYTTMFSDDRYSITLPAGSTIKLMHAATKFSPPVWGFMTPV